MTDFICVDKERQKYVRISNIKYFAAYTGYHDTAFYTSIDMADGLVLHVDRTPEEIYEDIRSWWKEER